MNKHLGHEPHFAVEISNVSKRFENLISPLERLANQFGATYEDEIVKAVSGVSLTIKKGSVLGLVGESGCGKSTLGRIVAGLLTATDGHVTLDGELLDAGHTSLKGRDLLRAQMIFQNPMASLNPRQKIVDILTEGPICHGMLKASEKTEFATELLAEVGLGADALLRLPHQFSGGQRQRIGIARALSVSPEFLICDEPVAALDVSVQAQIINLLLDLKTQRNLTMLFISHDLGVIRHLCDDVAVMYLGRIVETGPTDRLFANPRHPYTEALLNEITSLKQGRRDYQPIVGEIPSPLNPPAGCHFHPRCPHAFDRCRSEVPELSVLNDQATRCLLYSDDNSNASQGH